MLEAIDPRKLFDHPTGNGVSSMRIVLSKSDVAARRSWTRTSRKLKGW
jgi:hypothetical protein